MQGKLIILSAPSGSGKTTIARYLMSQLPVLEFSVSATTRGKRPGEVDGDHYHFISKDEFISRVQKGDFLEYEEVYDGIFYGTLKSEIGRIWGKGHHVVFDVDVVGGKHLKERYGDDALLIFIKLPTFEMLEHRLRGRSTETAEQMQHRLEKARQELEYEKYADVVLLNDTLEHAQANALKTVSDFINR